jgi:hypothetical protein
VNRLRNEKYLSFSLIHFEIYRKDSQRNAFIQHAEYKGDQAKQKKRKKGSHQKMTDGELLKKNAEQDTSET